ncbi:MAG TPA: NAD(P)H-dependent oxidoreductase subunit E [Clostridiaceae bacterium]|nr:NAD(P)H-dependent oxidoreductase subunit E [Clostridiaceae bacterium]
MIVEVCIGSSCHLKGSYQVIREIENFITREGLEDRIELKGAFCLGNCTEAVSVRVGERILSFSPEDAVRQLEGLMEEKACS